jgi:peptidoglycan/xylan/chitin deacetylase (PgdA/CDA1 family)
MPVRAPSRGRVLVYHQPDAARFAAQIREIGKTFEFVDTADAVRRLQGTAPTDGRRSFALVTFDDGLRDFLGVMDDLLRLEIPACLYITTEYLGQPGYLDAGDVRSISQSFDIGSHATSHLKLSGLDPAQCARELDDSKRYLEDLIGKPVVHFAVPFGGPASFGESVIRGAGAAGYETFRTTFRGWNRPRSADRSGVRVLRADVIEDWYPSWRLRATLAGALDWRAGRRLRRALAG